MLRVKFRRDNFIEAPLNMKPTCPWNKKPNDGFQLQRAISIQAEGKDNLISTLSRSCKTLLGCPLKERFY